MLTSRLVLSSLFVVFLLQLPRSSESCIHCYHPRAITHSPNSQNHGAQAVAIAVPQKIQPYGVHVRSKSIAAASAAGRQFVEIFKKRWLKLQNTIYVIPKCNVSIVRITASAAVAAGGIVVLSRHQLPSMTREKLYKQVWRNEAAEGQDDATNQNDGSIFDDEDEEDFQPLVDKEESPMTTAMIATIGVYKNFISPLLPPACRFVPTCSQYGVQAIKEFGPSKGVVLTSWRLLRCSPFGGKGYDPPKWPPVSYTYSSY
ncbi:unnamed protein product [Pseudo-nitzschia multistriata]|uniref:Membrane protein insertion efficiency factor n=1 Tax=Pseudo-nitzschia multistriata TaxID=183589 RepID=A0A448ZKR4_9STRA|nr:unnamed protein product [Pseudo-nitzschia multistriata]